MAYGHPAISQADYAQYSPRPYPDFGSFTGYLTVHGQQAEVLLGGLLPQLSACRGLLTAIGYGSAPLVFPRQFDSAFQISPLPSWGWLFNGITVPRALLPSESARPDFHPFWPMLCRKNPLRARPPKVQKGRILQGQLLKRAVAFPGPLLKAGGDPRFFSLFFFFQIKSFFSFPFF